MIYFIVLFTVFILYILYQLSVYKINTVNLKNDKVKNKIRILQISDFHNNKLINLKKLEKDIKKFNPDLVFLTGDIISRDTKNDLLLRKFLNILNNYKTYFVSGNHELENKYIDYKLILNDYNITDLSSKSLNTKVGKTKLYICGLSFGDNNIKGTSNENYNILISHNPDTFINSNIFAYDLVLSGHNHGGQFVLPFFGQVIDHDLKLFPKYSSGLYRLNNSDFYISKGLGQRINFRFNCRVSIEEIIIE